MQRCDVQSGSNDWTELQNVGQTKMWCARPVRAPYHPQTVESTATTTTTTTTTAMLLIALLPEDGNEASTGHTRRTGRNVGATDSGGRSEAGSRRRRGVEFEFEAPNNNNSGKLYFVLQ
jgi:hypothetical protein